MSRPVVLLSGFGAFEGVRANPSGSIARALARTPPAGWRVEGVVLPVSFTRGPRAWDAARARLRSPPALFLSLGVSKEPAFRLERCASPRLRHVRRPDVDGTLPRSVSRPGPVLSSALDLGHLVRVVRREMGVSARISRSAGGYVCECMYHHVLVRGQAAGVPTLFVHVPPLAHCALPTQVEVVGRILAELGPMLAARGRQSSARSSRGRASGVAGVDAAKVRTASRKGASSRPM